MTQCISKMTQLPLFALHFTLLSTCSFTLIFPIFCPPSLLHHFCVCSFGAFLKTKASSAFARFLALFSRFYPALTLLDHSCFGFDRDCVDGFGADIAFGAEVLFGKNVVGGVAAAGGPSGYTPAPRIRNKCSRKRTRNAATCNM